MWKDNKDNILPPENKVAYRAPCCSRLWWGNTFWHSCSVNMGLKVRKKLIVVTVFTWCCTSKPAFGHRSGTTVIVQHCWQNVLCSIKFLLSCLSIVQQTLTILKVMLIQNRINMIVLCASTTARHVQLTNTNTPFLTHSTGKYSYVLVLCSTPPLQKEKDFCLPPEEDIFGHCTCMKRFNKAKWVFFSHK